MAEGIYYKERHFTPDEFYDEFDINAETEAVKSVEVRWDNDAQEYVMQIEIEPV